MAVGAGLLALIGCGGGGFGGGGRGGGGGGGGGGDPPADWEPFIFAANEHANGRTETLRASVPFPEGAFFNLNAGGVAGFPTAWMPMQHWPDGSIRIAQAQFTDTLAPWEGKRYTFDPDATPLRGAFQPNPWVSSYGADLKFGSRVRDRFGVSYSAQTIGDGRTIHETPLVRVGYHRLYHRADLGGGIGRDFLTAQFYVTQFRDVPFVCVDWIVGNDYLGADDPAGSSDPNLYPLGGIDVDSAEFRVQGHTEVRAYEAAWHAVPNPVTTLPWTSFQVMSDTYIDDGQTRRYRFWVYVEDPGAAQGEKDRWRASLAAMSESNMIPLTDITTWQLTAGLGIHGGPQTGPEDAAQLARDEYWSWAGRDHFGTWGSFGDTLYTGTSGSPRNGPLSPEIGHAIQAGYPRLLVKLEQKAWAQAMRPYHLYGLQVGAEQRILLWDPIPIKPGSRDLSHESLGRRAIWSGVDPYAAYRNRVDFRGHGWNGYDDEHFTLDLLFDYWTVTGDAWAREELRQLGESNKGLMRLADYATAHIRRIRAEGWTMRGFVHAYLATGDEAIKLYAMRRISEIIEAGRLRGHPSRSMREDNWDPRVGLPPGTNYFSPWEHGPFLTGYLGAYKFFGDPLALSLAENAFQVVEYAWVTDYTHPRTGDYVANGIRYAAPMSRDGVFVPVDFVDDDPDWGATVSSPGLGGVGNFLFVGINLIPKYSTNPDLRARAIQKGDLMLAGSSPWNHWAFIIPRLYE